MDRCLALQRDSGWTVVWKRQVIWDGKGWIVDEGASAGSAFFNEIVVALFWIRNACEEMKDKTVDMSIKVEELYEQAPVAVISIRTTEGSELSENVLAGTSGKKRNILELQTRPGLVEEATKSRKSKNTGSWGRG